MREVEHFKQSYETGETPWDIGKPDLNLIHTVTSTPIEPCKALEIGCGTGDNAIWLSQQKFNVLGVDVSPIAIHNASDKAAKANVGCTFVVLDVLQTDVEGAPFRFVFDSGFLHTIDSDEIRKSFVERLSQYLEPDGLWLSLLGNADEQRQLPGPPQWTARDIVNAVEPHFEILSLVSSYFETKLSYPPRAWVCLMRKR
jgi:methyl halide transferase